MKKLVLAVTVLVLSLVSLAQSPSLKRVDLQQNATAVAAQETAAQAEPATNRDRTTPTCPTASRRTGTSSTSQRR